MNRCLLLSGGIDSVALCYWMRPHLAITLDYGQAAAEAEIHASQEVARTLSIWHEVLRVDCSSVGSGTMARRRLEAECGACVMASPSPEWWPFRNQLLVTLAAARCITTNCNEIVIGTVKTDSQHRDGTIDFVRLLDAVLCFQEGHLSLVAPAAHLTSIDLVKASRVPVSVLAWAHSCHCGNIPCCICRGCYKYRDVWERLYSVA
jgi:7-cyano-7-deazaguanine synthase